MARYLSFVLLAVFAMVSLVGCHASGEVGDTQTSIVAPR